MEEIIIMTELPAELRSLTAQIVSAHCAHNTVAVDALPALISQVHQALAELARSEGSPAPTAEELVPAVPIKRSVFPDYLVCLEDGKKLKMLKRHLQSAYGMTPDDYRSKWGLPSTYPMVAPTYAERRSELAKTIGLGRGVQTPQDSAPEQEEPEIQQIPKHKRGRKKA